MIKREATAFLMVGILTVLVDFITYRGLVWSNYLEVDTSKAAGFLSGTVFAYFANKLWTFAHTTHKTGDVFRFLALYSLTLGVNVLINKSLLGLFSNISLSIPIAFVAATGTSAILNFIGMKFFVFNDPEQINK